MLSKAYCFSYGRKIHVFLATTVTIPLSCMGFLANGLRNFGNHTKNHPTLIKDRDPDITEHYRLIRLLNPRTRFAERHARIERTRTRGYNYPVVLEVDKIWFSKAGTNDGKGAIGYIWSKPVWLTSGVTAV